MRIVISSILFVVLNASLAMAGMFSSPPADASGQTRLVSRVFSSEIFQESGVTPLPSYRFSAQESPKAMTKISANWPMAMMAGRFAEETPMVSDWRKGAVRM